MSTETIIYHNPRCSKSRQTLALLEENGIAPTVVEYLNDPPDAATLQNLLSMLGLEPRELMRQKESVYADLDLSNPALGSDDLIAAMQANPILIERPIVVRGEQAVIGRPPENVLAIL